MVYHAQHIRVLIFLENPTVKEVCLPFIRVQSTWEYDPSLGEYRLSLVSSLYVVVIHCARLFLTPWTAAHHTSLSFTISWSLLKLMSTELLMPSNHLILSSPSPPALNVSQNQGLFPVNHLFASGGQSIGAPASVSVLPMNIQG